MAVRAPSAFELTIGTLWHLDRGAERLTREMTARKLGLVLGWATLIEGNKDKREEMQQIFDKELHKVGPFDPSTKGNEKELMPVTTRMLEVFGLNIPDDLIQYKDEEHLLERLYITYGDIVDDKELALRLDVNIPPEMRNGIIHLWIEQETQTMDRFLKNMLDSIKGKEGQNIKSLEAPSRSGLQLES